jgi:hypothetical protein
MHILCCLETGLVLLPRLPWNSILPHPPKCWGHSHSHNVWLCYLWKFVKRAETYWCIEGTGALESDLGLNSGCAVSVLPNQLHYIGYLGLTHQVGLIPALLWVKCCFLKRMIRVEKQLQPREAQVRRKGVHSSWNQLASAHVGRSLKTLAERGLHCRLLP